ncbi:NAD(P)H-binding protein [filamentous cyanobacterium LEGE 11480]|uniref:NAD(P)H-binding protein n=1 Tax=Romeriopsis navalis LEGE 11480 TaxID=2777977 RepID=A0A928Z3K0_9CYAN|nr:NAD(P)H-binding protein [Romeriopsis navalis]MBE9029298.1 NAD(P)H-binding protein [Romeriopsis navalis LEGE 11480]
MARIAITAASGQLGREIVKATSLVIGQANVIGLARTPAKAAHLDVAVRQGNYNNRDVLEASLQGIDTVLLVSGIDAPDQRIGQHRNVIEAAKAAGVTKIVYTSVQGAAEGTTFSPVIQSNRQTEQDIRDSGLQWSIGRNGIYIEPDVEYIKTYKQAGEIANCAGAGKCGYTTRPELAYAYSRMLTENQHNDHIYNLHGEAITQSELAEYLNVAFGTQLTYRDMTVEDYRSERVAALGEFMGTVITGIYAGIRAGAANNPSDFFAAAGRAHQSWQDYFIGLKQAL